MISHGPRLSFVIGFLMACVFPLQAQDITVEKAFSAVPFELWSQQEHRVEIPWKLEIKPYGLSLHQRLRAYVGVELKRRELVKRSPEGRLLVLLQVVDGSGQRFRDYGILQPKDFGEARKGEIGLNWDMYMLPGMYHVTVMLVDTKSGEHNVRHSPLRIEALKDDPLPGVWTGLPAVEFLDPHMRGPDALYRSEILNKLHLPLATAHPVRLEILADVTASDLFHGSTTFYNRYLGVALPLLKALSQIELEQGSTDVAMLDLRKHSVTFEQDNVKELDWKRAKAVLAPENGPATIDIKALEQKRESPAFLQDELLRRLNVQEAPLHVFVIIGSPMDFYSFRNLPHLPHGSEEKCVVYYLQFELLNTAYADGAIGNVRRMLSPLRLHVFKVRSAESVRHALAKILAEVAEM
jgi:hypothetical protein